MKGVALNVLVSNIRWHFWQQWDVKENQPLHYTHIDIPLTDFKSALHWGGESLHTNIMSDRKHNTHTGANFALVLVQEAFMLLEYSH
jgi:hypothetical protein